MTFFRTSRNWEGGFYIIFSEEFRESSRHNTIRGNRTERKSASERVSERTSENL